MSESPLQPYAHQVGGHSTQDGVPASLVDEQGRFLKLLQAGERGEREVAFYAAVERARPQLGGDGGGSSSGSGGGAAGASDGSNWTSRGGTEAEGGGGGGGGSAGGPRVGGAGSDAAVASAGGSHPVARDDGLAALSPWVPRSFGTRCVCGRRYLALEDAAGGYAAPCVLDAKLGPRTWYPWAAPALIAKYRAKDDATTQGTLGFRVCGVRVARADGTVWRGDRHWGKGLDRGGVVAALRRYADNGALPPAAVLGPVLSQLQLMAGVFSRQAAVHLFSSSVLLLYEGAARTPEEARVAVRLIDFAHAFPEGVHPGGPDTNFAAGLAGLTAAIQEALA